MFAQQNYSFVIYAVIDDEYNEGSIYSIRNESWGTFMTPSGKSFKACFCLIVYDRFI